MGWPGTWPSWAAWSEPSPPTPFGSATGLTYWWIRSPLGGDGPLLPHRTFHTLWSAPLWGDSLSRALAVALVVAAFIGVILLNQTRRRAAARLFGLGSLTFLGLALAGMASEPLGRLGTSRLLTPALLFAAVPAAQARSASRPWRRG